MISIHKFSVRYIFAENNDISETYSLIICHFLKIIFVLCALFIDLYTIRIYNKRYKKERKRYKNIILEGTI